MRTLMSGLTLLVLSFGSVACQVTSEDSSSTGAAGPNSKESQDNLGAQKQALEPKVCAHYKKVSTRCIRHLDDREKQSQERIVNAQVTRIQSLVADVRFSREQLEAECKAALRLLPDRCMGAQ